MDATSRVDQVRRCLEELREVRQRATAELQVIRRPGVYPVAYQDARIADLRRRYAAEAREQAEATWRAVREAQLSDESQLGRDSSPVQSQDRQRHSLELRLLEAEVRHVILETEAAATGLRSASGTPSRWAVEILGDFSGAKIA